MDTKKLEIFVCVAKMGNITKAAEAFGYTQSGVTHIIHSLEKELGVTLLKRSRFGVQMTDTAKVLLPKFEKIVEDCNDLEFSLEKTINIDNVQLRIGSYASMASHWLPTILNEYKKSNPEVKISLHMGGITDLYDMLDCGDLDCAFVSYQASRIEGKYDWMPLRNDELVAVLPKEFQTKSGLFNIRDFAKTEFLMPSDSFDLDIMPVLNMQNVNPHILSTNMDDVALISMVSHGLGVSILSELIVSGRREGVKVLPLTPPAYRQLGIAIRREKSKRSILSHFVKISTEYIMNL